VSNVYLGVHSVLHVAHAQRVLIKPIGSLMHNPRQQNKA